MNGHINGERINTTITDEEKARKWDEFEAKRLAYQRDYRARNKERIAAYHKEYRKNNPEYFKAYYEKVKGSRKKYMKEYMKTYRRPAKSA